MRVIHFINMSNLTLEGIIACIALVISVITLFVEIIQNSKNTKINSESEIFNQIFYEHLLKKIPEARQKIIYSNSRIVGTEDLIKELNTLRQDALYFKYKDKKFYKLLKQSLQSLEDKLVSQELKEEEDYAELYNEISKDLESIYSLIMSKQIRNSEIIKKVINRFKRKAVVCIFIVLSLVLVFWCTSRQ